MIQKKNTTGILLAGGKSSRMGTDKGFLELKGISFTEHIIAAMRPWVQEIILVSDSVAYDRFGVRRVVDHLRESGPLAGIYSGLFHSETEYNMVLSCDIPKINETVLKLLIDGIDPEKEITQIESCGKTMPLIAVYKKQCMHPIWELLLNGERRVREAVKHFQTKTIALDSKWDSHVQNINTPEQLKALQNETED